MLLDVNKDCHLVDFNCPGVARPYNFIFVYPFAKTGLSI